MDELKQYMKNLAAAGAIMAMIGLALIALAHGCLAQHEINQARAGQYQEASR